MPVFEPVAQVVEELHQPRRVIFHSYKALHEVPTWSHLFTEAQLTAAYEQGKRDAIPEGFVLVPKEPTNEMQEAFYVEIEKGEWAINTWEAMIAAAQKGESCNTPSPT